MTTSPWRSGLPFWSTTSRASGIVKNEMRIGINALYLIPGGVGGTEIYLRSLLAGLAEIDSTNQYFVFTNRETGGSLAPKAPNFTSVPQAVRAAFRPGRILWEQ